MDLRTTYLGFHLPHPLIPGASPLVDDLGVVKRLEDAGAPAIVMHSLFEEQIETEASAHLRAMETHAHSFSEAHSYLPDPEEFALGPEEYLEQLRRIRETVAVPVFGSINGSSRGSWIHYARLMQDAGAAAIELNVYEVVTDTAERGESVEARLVDLVSAVRAEVTVPIAVKLSPFLSSIPNVAARLCKAGAQGLVLFNRFYEPDIDVEQLELRRTLRLSTSSELLMRLHWIAILWGRVEGDLALTGGVHTAVDAIKATMVGASAVQLVSCLLAHGPERLGAMRDEIATWLEKNEYLSLDQARGSMSLLRCPDPHALERANYARILQTWR